MIEGERRHLTYEVDGLRCAMRPALAIPLFIISMFTIFLAISGVFASPTGIFTISHDTIERRRDAKRQAAHHDAAAAILTPRTR